MSITTGHQHRVPGREGAGLAVAHTGLCHMGALAGAFAVTSHRHIEGVQVAAWDGRLPTLAFNDCQDQQAEEQGLGGRHGHHFQGRGTECFAEWLAEWLFLPPAGLQKMLALWVFICQCSAATPSWRSAFRPASLPEISAKPPGKSCSSLRCGPQRAASATFCFPSV